MVYYNEIDPFAAEWLKNLMDRNLIAQGVVDTRSIVDVEPSDLTGFTQCHFFAGIGGWSRALRLAGWSDDRAVWSGSAPCQPFSSAGRQAGYDDERHLAPAWLRLIKECRPPVCFGEQVASAASNKKHPWLDDLQDELEAEGYATGALVLPACSVGGPHIRQRLWIVARRLADPTCVGLERSGCANSRGCSDGIRARSNGHRDCSASGGMANITSQRFDRREGATWEGRRDGLEVCGASGGLADTCSQRRQQIRGSASSDEETNGRTRRDECRPQDNNQPTGYGKGIGMANSDRVECERQQDIRPAGVQSSLRGEAGPSTYGGPEYTTSIRQCGGFSDKTGELPEVLGSGHAFSGLANRNSDGQFPLLRGQQLNMPEDLRSSATDGLEGRVAEEHSGKPQGLGGSVEGDGSDSPDSFWSNPDWLFCRDGKWRPVKSGAKPLVNGVPGGVVPSSDRCSAEHAEETDEARVGRLKGYGNAIVPQVAAEVIRVFIDYERFLYMIDE